ncbi:MAG: alpha/beta fold hydrolase [Chloroflexota bacterium]|nr:alpha/beta fold hydrolase [Chloroflexota bacterium]
MAVVVDAFASEEHAPFLLRGCDKAALLIHGFLGTPAELRPLGDRLHQAGWTVQAPLLPGFGTDIATLSQRRVRDWTAFVSQHITDLRGEHSRVVLVGFSMGGAIALNLVPKTPLDQLALINPFTRLDVTLWNLLPVLHRVVPKYKPFQMVKLDFNSPEVRKNIEQFMPGADLDNPQVRQQILSLELPTAALEQLRAVGQHAWDAAPQVMTPTLIIQATNDKTVPPAKTRALYERMRPGARFIEVSGEHNFIRYEPHALAMAAGAILEFIG